MLRRFFAAAVLAACSQPTSKSAEPVWRPYPCEQDPPARGAALQVREVVDHIAAVIVYPDTTHIPWATHGEPCRSEACRAAYEKAIYTLSMPRRPCAQVHGCAPTAYLVTTHGEEVRTWVTPDEVARLLGDVSSVEEAYLIANAAQGANLPTCGDDTASAFQQSRNDFVLRERRWSRTCGPQERVELTYRVDAQGHTTQLPERVFFRAERECGNEDAVRVTN